MNGLIIWAQSNCRSVMGLYAALKRKLPYPVVVAVRDYNTDCQPNMRERTGFKDNEFSEVELVKVGTDYDKCKTLWGEHPGFRHLIANYQSTPVYRQIAVEAARNGEKVLVMSESPCNMSNGIKGWLKNGLYFRYLLPRKVKGVIASSVGIANLSGNSSTMLQKIGWPGEKIIPFGYYPPPIPQSKCVRRGVVEGSFKILSTGLMEWHRSPDVLIKALVLLHKWGLRFEATFTQGGALLPVLQEIAEREHLSVRFAGRVPLSELIHMYETCSVFVASGRSEPWGMRINDAIQCGAPVVISRGMGACALVDEYHCGMTFERDDHVDLAYKLRRMMTDAEVYSSCADAAVRCAESIGPDQMARELVAKVPEFF